MGVAGTDELDCAIPGAGYEGVFGHRTPAHRKGFPLVLVKVHNRELVDTEIEQLQRAVAAGSQELVLIDLRPGEIVKRIISVEAAGRKPPLAKLFSRF
jgi:hypothetical protein